MLVCISLVLILIVVEDGLVLANVANYKFTKVLILIVVEDGLVHRNVRCKRRICGSLNPYCSGRWSRTRPYKTLLIINKLKNFTKQVFTFLNRKLTIS